MLRLHILYASLTPILIAAAAIVVACGGTAGGAAPKAASGPGDRARGQQIVVQQCAACHTVDSVPQAKGTVGPNLTHVASQPQIAGTLPMSEENLKRWVSNPPAVKPGTAMPNLGLSQSQVNDVVAFLLTLR